MIYLPFPFKRCSQCDQYKLPTAFTKVSRNSTRLRAECTQCKHEYNNKWRREHPENRRGFERRYRERHPDRIKVHKKRYAEKHKDQVLRNHRLWRNKNRERINEQNRQYRKDHPDRMRVIERRRNQKHHQKRAEYNANYHKTHLDLKRAQSHRRRARMINVPSTFTTDQWDDALVYWHGVCAYCGNPARLFDLSPMLHQDHFMPVVLGGGYTPDNMLPACQSCNFSKNDKEPKQWIIEKFGKRKANQILKRIEVYFQHVEIHK